MKKLFEKNLFNLKEKRSKSETDNRQDKTDYSREKIKKQIFDIFFISNSDDLNEISKFSKISNRNFLNENQISELLENEIYVFSNKNSKDKKYREKSLKILNKIRGKTNSLLRNYIRYEMIDLKKLVFDEKIFFFTNDNKIISENKLDIYNNENLIYLNSNQIIFGEKFKNISKVTKVNLNKIPKIPISNIILNGIENYKEIEDINNSINEISNKYDKLTYDPYKISEFDYDIYYRDNIQKSIDFNNNSNPNPNPNPNPNLNKNIIFNELNSIEFDKFNNLNNIANHNNFCDENRIYTNNLICIDNNNLIDEENYYKIEKNNNKLENILKDSYVENPKCDLINKNTEKENLDYKITNSQYNIWIKDLRDISQNKREEKINDKLLLEDKDNYFIKNAFYQNSLDKNSISKKEYLKRSITTEKDEIQSIKSNNINENNKDKIDDKYYMDINTKFYLDKDLLDIKKITEKSFTDDLKINIKDSTQNSINKNHKPNQKIFNLENLSNLRKQIIEMDIDLTLSKKKLHNFEYEIKRLKNENELWKMKEMEYIRNFEIDKISLNKLSSENDDFRKENIELIKKLEIFKNLNKKLEKEFSQLNIDLFLKVNN